MIVHTSEDYGLQLVISSPEVKGSFANQAQGSFNTLAEQEEYSRNSSAVTPQMRSPQITYKGPFNFFPSPESWLNSFHRVVEIFSASRNEWGYY